MSRQQLPRSPDGPHLVVDCHAHYVPETLIGTLAEGVRFPGIGVRTAAGALRFSFGGRPTSPPAPAGISRLPEFSSWLDRHGIDVQILSPWTDLFGYPLAQEEACTWVSYLNDCMISAASADTRFATLAAIPLAYPGEAVTEIRRSRSAGHVGVIIGTSAPGVELDDPRLDPVWAELAATDMPVLVHPTFLTPDPRLQAHGLVNAVGRAQETTVALSRLLLSGALLRHPRLTMIAAHGGGTLPFLLQRLQRAHELNPGTSAPAESFARLHTDSVVLDPRVLRALLEFTPPDRILLGSDYPFPWEPDPVGLVRRALGGAPAALGGTPAALGGAAVAQAILGGNASRLFALASRSPSPTDREGQHATR